MVKKLTIIYCEGLKKIIMSVGQNMRLSMVGLSVKINSGYVKNEISCSLVHVTIRYVLDVHKNIPE